MVELSNAKLQLCFDNYDRALNDKRLCECGERFLIVKSLDGEDLKIFVEPSYNIHYVKLNIEYINSTRAIWIVWRISLGRLCYVKENIGI